MGVLEDLRDFIYLELPQRPVLIKGIDADGDPNLSLIAKVNGSPIGTYYLRNDVVPRTIQYKSGNSATDWLMLSLDTTSDETSISLDSSTLMEIEVRLSLLETSISNIFIESGLEIVLSTLSNGTNTYTLTKNANRVLVAIDGILQYDYVQPNNTNILKLGFIPREDSYIYAYSFGGSGGTPTDSTGSDGTTIITGAENISELLDVDFTTPPTDGQVLLYDEATGKQKPTTLAEGGGNIFDGGTF